MFLKSIPVDQVTKIPVNQVTRIPVNQVTNILVNQVTSSLIALCAKQITFKTFADSRCYTLNG